MTSTQNADEHDGRIVHREIEKHSATLHTYKPACSCGWTGGTYMIAPPAEEDLAEHLQFVR